MIQPVPIVGRWSHWHRRVARGGTTTAVTHVPSPSCGPGIDLSIALGLTPPVLTTRGAGYSWNRHLPAEPPANTYTGRWCHRQAGARAGPRSGSGGIPALKHLRRREALPGPGWRNRVLMARFRSRLPFWSVRATKSSKGISSTNKYLLGIYSRPGLPSGPGP